jgi:4-aminobutyrate aminotransferase / (S)-3-amino-2-methylpropionate transaminase
MGDPVRAHLARAIIGEIEKMDLLKNVQETGNYLYEGLSGLATQFPTRIANLRGYGEGTFIAWDESSTAARDKFILDMKKNGVNMGGTGAAGVRLRPMLVCGKRHIDILLGRLETCFKAN